MNPSLNELLPEYENNPFINRLSPAMPMRKALAFLNDPPAFNPEERLYPHICGCNAFTVYAVVSSR